VILDQVLGDWIRESIPNARAMWSALANIEWEDTHGNIAAFSFRAAAYIVSNIHEGYEFSWFDDDVHIGVVDSVIEKAMAGQGWTWRKL
jgi:hypothetical protein